MVKKLKIKGGRTFSEGWNSGTNDIKSGANTINEKKTNDDRYWSGSYRFKNGLKTNRENQIKAMSPTLSIGGRRRRRKNSRKRKTKRRSRKRKTSEKNKKTSPLNILNKFLTYFYTCKIVITSLLMVNAIF